jgi:hypothetical protein
MTKGIIGLAIVFCAPMTLSAESQPSTISGTNVISSNPSWTLTGTKISSDGTSIQCSEACTLTTKHDPAMTMKAERIVVNKDSGKVTLSGAASVTSGNSTLNSRDAAITLGSEGEKVRPAQ